MPIDFTDIIDNQIGEEQISQLPPPITALNNFASIIYRGNVIDSNIVQTLIYVEPLIVISCDKTRAFVGDVLTYTVTIVNQSEMIIRNLPFEDALPTGCQYRANTFTYNGALVTPAYSNNILTFTIPRIVPFATAVITFQVVVTG